MKEPTNLKYSRRHNDHSVDDWLMTYADMITLLLCFFAIFLSVSVPKDEQMEKAKEKVLEQFASPETIPGKTTPQYSAFDGREKETPMPYKNLPSIVDRFEMPEEMPAEKPEGDRLLTLDIPSAAFFAIGTASLSPEGYTLLEDIIRKNLTTEDHKDYLITVEGHTDDSPISTAQFPSNWELSTARAAAVVRFFIEHGIPAARLRAAGYADARPKVPNRDTEGKPIPDNQAQNRRVVIRLEKVEKSPAPDQ